jgi:hypothetical protein
MLAWQKISDLYAKLTIAAQQKIMSFLLFRAVLLFINGL